MSYSDLLSAQPPYAGTRFDCLLQEVAGAAESTDRSGEWPQRQFELLANAGVLGWVIPAAYGGSNVSAESLVYGYECLAAACLTTSFVLTQRNGACQRIAGCDHGDLKAELLGCLADGELSATVGISHLTTSRQHTGKPAVAATLKEDVIEISGQIPWVTGAPHADYVVTGGTCADGRQVLIALPTGLEGVRVQSPVLLLALNGSQTASIDVDQVQVDRRFLLAGPVEGVMQQGIGGGTGSVATSSLAVGLAGRTITLLKAEAEQRDDLWPAVDQFHVELEALRRDLYAAARGKCTEATPHLSNASIRRRSNSMALRTTQALMAASKGAGFVAGHPAERSVRESMFFLVWSCPQPLMQAALREFACLMD
jgi:alkylation response protein AidB-like acyl-CoA dehydrogenase